MEDVTALMQWRSRRDVVINNHTNEKLPQDVVDAIMDLTSQLLTMRREIEEIKGALGQFYTRLSKAA